MEIPLGLLAIVIAAVYIFLMSNMKEKQQAKYLKKVTPKPPYGHNQQVRSANLNSLCWQHGGKTATAKEDVLRALFVYKMSPNELANFTADVLAKAKAESSLLCINMEDTKNGILFSWLSQYAIEKTLKQI